MAPKILLADDEPDVLESTALLAESLGYEVVRVPRSDAIFEAALRERPDVMLQDLKMPGLNLAGLVAALRSEPLTAEIPLVFYGAGRDLGATATRYDAWGYLTKPFGRGDMNRLLSQILDHAPTHAGRNISREVKGLFHEILDHVTSVTNYLRVLELAPDMQNESQRALRGAAESLLKLEVKMNGLRTYVTGLAAAIEPVAARSAERGRTAAPGSVPGEPVAADPLPLKTAAATAPGVGPDPNLGRWSRPPQPGSTRPAAPARRDSAARRH